MQKAPKPRRLIMNTRPQSNINFGSRRDSQGTELRPWTSTNQGHVDSVRNRSTTGKSYMGGGDRTFNKFNVHNLRMRERGLSSGNLVAPQTPAPE